MAKKLIQTRLHDDGRSFFSFPNQPLNTKDEKLLPLLGKSPNRFLLVWNKLNKTVKYRKITDFCLKDFEEIKVMSDELAEVKKEISLQLGVIGWADEK